MRIADIKWADTANGTGCRVSLWLQGCKRFCKGCFNPETWDINGGRDFTNDDKSYIFGILEEEYCKGLSILGGEPILQSEELYDFLSEVKTRFPHKNIWLWTGYRIDEIADSHFDLINMIDYIVDGDFQEDKKNLNLTFRGSENQRIIDVKKYIESKMLPFCGEEEYIIIPENER